MIRIKEAVIVEGKYDKIKLESVVDTMIITTNGFSIFNDKQNQKFIRNVAEKRGIVILTDSDSAGFMIRNKILGLVDKSLIKNAYIPQLIGKEKRKRAASKEGYLGVEGIDVDIIAKAFKKAGVKILDDDKNTNPNGRKITKTDLFELGLSGGEKSSYLRKELLKRLDFPDKMSSNAIIDALNMFMTYDELSALMKEITIGD